MDGTAHVVFLVEVAAGIIVGFMLWSYISPMVSSMSPTPTA